MSIDRLKQIWFYLKFSIPVTYLILIIVFLSYYIPHTLSINNNSTQHILIESLRKIEFTDKSTNPWKRKYKYYLDNYTSKIILPNNKLDIDIPYGYYGIKVCNSEACVYTNFKFKYDSTVNINNNYFK